MKRILIYISIVFSLISCSEKWDEHYDKNVINENESALTLKEYFDGAADYSQFYTLLKDNELDVELGKEQLLTVWAVRNENFDMSVVGNIETSLVASYHLNYLSLGSTELFDGMRVQAFNGIYLTVNESEDVFSVNSTKIVSTKRFKNGVVHEVESVLKPLTNMFEFIRLLDDNYSIIRDSIMTYNREIFDKKNSTPKGVDETGNTIYDSVFYTSNPLFEIADFSSEFNQYTMFLPSNEVISGTFNKLKEQYGLMGLDFTTEDTTMAIGWIREAIFHEGEIKNYGESEDIVSPFSKVWRTSVQKIDPTSSQQMSNGVVYNVTDLKVPNNVIISRIKSLVHYYEFLTTEQQEEYYTLKGTISNKILKGDQTPISGFYYWLFELVGDPLSEEEFSIEYAPLDYDAETGTVTEMKVPPGEYNLYMGFRSKGHPYVDVLFQSGSDPISDNAIPVATELAASNSSPWNYDRVNETDPNIKKWNGLGGLVGVVNVTGDGMSTFRIKVRFNKLQTFGAAKKMQLYHWCLKPTENNY